MRIFRRWAPILALILLPACGVLVDEGRKVVATVDGDPIRLQEFMDRLRELPFEERAETNDPDASVSFAKRRALLDRIITEKLLLKEAEAEGIVIPDDEVEAILENEREREQSMTGATEEAEGHEHQAHGAEPSRGQIMEKRHGLMRAKIREKAFSNEAALRYYEGHLAEFTSPVPMVLCELVVADASNAKVIDEIHKKAQRENTSLREAVVSLGGSPPLIFAGLTPLAPINVLVPEMKEALDKLDQGKISEPFHLHPQGMDHYAVARVILKTNTIPFESVKQRLQEKMRKEFIEGLRKKFEVVYNDEALRYRVGQ